MASCPQSVRICKGVAIYGGKHIHFGDQTIIQRYSVIEAIDQFCGEAFAPDISIGQNANLGEYNHISCIGRLHIGNGFLSGRRVTIVDHNHGSLKDNVISTPPMQRKLCSKGVITIGDNVWVGENAMILGGVTIGDGAIIAANAVVTKDVPCATIVAGIPAQIIKQKKEKA